LPISYGNPGQTKSEEQQHQRLPFRPYSIAAHGLKAMTRKPATPNCYIIAGPNGAGKTTFATEFLPLYANCRNFINADLIARAYSPFDPDAGLLRAGRAVLERIAEFTEAGTDFAFETTLSGRAYVPLLRRVKKSGFRLHLFYLWIPSPELALLRIRDRVESGGHAVPEPDVRRRFNRSLRNLFALYRPLLDTLYCFDNSSDTPRLIFKDEVGQTVIGDAALYGQLQRKFAP
jgi:predicted ABC-type ATPase